MLLVTPIIFGAECMIKLCPYVNLHISRDKPAYIDSTIIEMGHFRDKLFKKARISKIPADWNAATEQRLLTNKAVKKAKQKFIKNKMNSSQGDTKKFWSEIRTLLPKPVSRSVTKFYDGEGNLLSGVEACNFAN